jgi:hypothetical protein
MRFFILKLKQILFIFLNLLLFLFIKKSILSKINDKDTIFLILRR